MTIITVTPISLTSLPTELVEPILGELDQHSLTTCARTSKAWSALCTPYLWRSVNITGPQQLEQFLTTESQDAVYRNATHLINLYLGYSSIYNIFSPLSDGLPSVHHSHVLDCTNLRHLNILPVQ
jgi:hypothetical protein